MKTKFFLISTIIFMFLALKSSGQTTTIQKLDSLYPYHAIFADSAKITEKQYKTLNEIKRKELFIKYKAQIEEDDLFNSTMNSENMKKNVEMYQKGIDSLKKK